MQRTWREALECLHPEVSRMHPPTIVGHWMHPPTGATPLGGLLKLRKPPNPKLQTPNLNPDPESLLMEQQNFLIRETPTLLNPYPSSVRFQAFQCSHSLSLPNLILQHD